MRYASALVLGEVLGSYWQLVQIGIEYQVPASRPDVTNLHQGILRQQVLNAQSPLIDRRHLGHQIAARDRNGQLWERR